MHTVYICNPDLEIFDLNVYIVKLCFFTLLCFEEFSLLKFDAMDWYTQTSMLEEHTVTMFREVQVE
jgi:hypothetical protein